ncbi:MAG: ABC-type rhamnose uptake system permease component RhaP [Rhodobacteraceae bacterium HLUCCA08]|nr:MAG: ABC-type rhamnose uptake system permease component RhaP [Rhodobacteraceae bacterium HLUCCA08]
MLRLMDRLNPQVLRILALLAVLVAVILFFAAVVPNYLNGRLFNRVSSSVAIMALIATAQTLVIITRNIDLSIGSTVGFVAFATGSLITNNPDLGPVVLVLYAMALGAVFGAINGLLVAFARVPSIIVTLGTMALFRSALVEYSDSKSISTANLPEWLVSFPNTVLWQWGQMQFRAAFVAAVVVVLIVHVALSRLRAARRLYAIGSNPEAAEMAGIDTRKTVFVAFVLAGALAGLGGFMFLARFGTITVVAGLGFELKSVAAAVVGGVNIFGGSGTVIGALIGAILVDLIDTSLVRWQMVSEFWREAVLGILILLSVAADALLMRRLVAARAAREHRKAEERIARELAAQAQGPAP